MPLTSILKHVFKSKPYEYDLTCKVCGYYPDHALHMPDVKCRACIPANTTPHGSNGHTLVLYRWLLGG